MKTTEAWFEENSAGLVSLLVYFVLGTCSDKSVRDLHD